MYTNLDSGHLIFSIFLDFHKAFDSVDHSILLSKLEIYGIRGHALSWFESYLSNRKQFVRVNNKISNLQQITYGVPQGSILGPLLFLIFINDINHSSNLFKFILYADDSTLSTRIHENQFDQDINKINSELNNVFRWLCANKITINVKKTKFMVFSYNRNVMLSEIKIGNYLISEADFIKFLGVYIDNHLTFKHHISEVSLKISKSVGLLFKLNKFFPYNILKIIYSSLIHPYLIYGAEAWHGTFKNLTNKIFILQKKAIRAINELDYNDHTNDYFKTNKILKLNDQYNFQIIKYIYQLFNTNIDEEMSAMLINSLQDHNYDTRNKRIINVTNVSRNRSKNNVFHNGVKSWNSLPDVIKNSKSLYT